MAVTSKRRYLRIFAALAGLLVITIFIMLVSMRISGTRPVSLPIPSGPYTVGLSLYDWVDTSIDPLTPSPGSKRELQVWIWYPANGNTGDPASEYMNAASRNAIEHNRGRLITKLFMRDLSQLRAHSQANADLSPAQASYPVLILRAGGSLEVANYSALAEDLASNGYVVVGLDAPYRTATVAFADGRVILRTPQNNPESCLYLTGTAIEKCAIRVLDAWNSDMSFVLDRLRELNGLDTSGRFFKRFDMSRVGVFGHSFGGASAALFCHQDARCKAAVDVDGAPHGSVIHEGLAIPFMFLLSDHSGEVDPESRQIRADIQSIYNRLPADTKLRVEIRGAHHMLFSDAGITRNPVIFRALRMFGQLPLDGPRQLAITSYCLRTFFDAHLKETRPSKLELASPLYPELRNLN